MAAREEVEKSRQGLLLLQRNDREMESEFLQAINNVRVI